MREDRIRHDTEAGSWQLPLLASKLAPPPVPAPVLARTRLLHRLDSGRPVTLVSAGAGWGKTTLLTAWFRHRAGDVEGDVEGDVQQDLVWLSVDRGDSEHFWSYLLAALRPVASAAPDGRTPYDPPAGPPDRELLVRLADGLARRSRAITLVIDDLHRVVDADVLEGLDFLLRHTARRLRLVIGARVDPSLPLHRWRLAGELTELRAADLRFTPEETGALLTAHRITLPAEQIARLHRRTEGWAAGLRIATLGLSRHPDPAGFVDAFGGEHPDVASYLAEEVLADLPEDVRETLLRTSLASPLTADLMGTLTGRPDGDLMLGRARRAVGFLIPLDPGATAYRLHTMLAELLRAELRRRGPAEVRDLHRAASGWYAARDRPADALRHALAAPDWDLAVQLLVGHWPELMPFARRDAPDRPQRPPETLVRAEPRLALACAVEELASFGSGVADGQCVAHGRCGAGGRCVTDGRGGADRYLRLAVQWEQAVPVGKRPSFTAMTTAVQLARAHLCGDYSGVRRLAGQLLDVGSSDRVEPAGGAEAIARAALGAAYLTVGDLVKAEAALAAGLSTAERAGLGRLAATCAARLALTNALRGGLRAARQAAATALQLGRGDLTDARYAYLALAQVAIHRGMPAEAEANLGLAVADAAATGAPGVAGMGEPRPPAALEAEPLVAALAELLRAQVLHDRGETTGSFRALAAGRRWLADRLPSERLTQWFVAAEAGLHLDRGDPATARRLLTPLLDGPAGPVEAVAVAMSRVYLHERDPRAAARTLPAWEAGDELPVPLRLEAGLVEACAAGMLGERPRAARLLERVLQLAELEDFRRVFFRAAPSVRDLLVTHLDSGTAHWSLVHELVGRTAAAAAPPRDRPTPAPTAAEPLTERELTVLRYLQSILSNVEIAAELSLSVNTVKTHVRNIYRKLDTTRRREAVRRARELHLL